MSALRIGCSSAHGREGLVQMELFSRLGLGSFLLVSLIVGVRLVLLARRSRKFPELIMGLSCTATGVGSVLVLASGPMVEAGSFAGEVLIHAGILLTSLAAACLCLAMWQIFRPWTRWAGVVTAAASLILLGCFAAILAAREAGVAPTDHAAYWIGFALRLACFAWVGHESLRYHLLLRRRLRLGLADPLMANRFLCWGISSVTTFICYLIYLIGHVRGVLVADSPIALSVVGLLGVVTGLSMWVAFLPPGFYRRLVAARSAAAPGAEP